LAVYILFKGIIILKGPLHYLSFGCYPSYNHCAPHPLSLALEKKNKNPKKIRKIPKIHKKKNVTREKADIDISFPFAAP
jgi:hypothetical protein